ncbi:MAG: hypothetical protein U0172_14825 [Nitrospiraceae bacterium]
MQIILDNEQWQVPDETTVMQVLADLSDRAAARRRVVTRVHVGSRAITDRDLQPLYLEKMLREVGAVRAESQSETILHEQVRATAQRAGVELRADGAALIQAMRAGQHNHRTFDLWLGRCADFMEGAAMGLSVAELAQQQELATWMEELLQARHSLDRVRLADVLEYEVLPRLPVAA